MLFTWIFPLFNRAPILTTSLTEMFALKTASMLSRAPASISLASSTSPSRLSRETSPISRIYIFTGSPVVTDRGQQTEEILALRVAQLTSRLFDDQFLPLVCIDDIDILILEKNAYRQSEMVEGVYWIRPILPVDISR